MKKLVIIALLLISINSYCPPPKPPTEHSNNTTVGVTDNVSAPIGSGTFFLILMATLFTSYRIYKASKTKEEIEAEE